MKNVWNYMFGSREERLDRNRQQVETLVAGEPNMHVLWRTYRLVEKDDKQPVGALVFAAVANYKMFGKTRKPRYLHKAVNYIDRAYERAEGEEKEHGVAPHWLAIHSDMNQLKSQERARKLVELRESTRRKVLDKRPNTRSISAASMLAAMDYEQQTGAYVLAAVANYRMFGRTGKASYIDSAMEYVSRAMELAISDEERENNIRPHFEAISRDHRNVHNTETEKPADL